MNYENAENELLDYEDYLVDLLGIWNCWDQCWVKGAPVILRFESNDVLAHPTIEGSPHFKIMHVGEDSSLLKEIEAVHDEDDPCLCWRSVHCEDVPIGEKLCFDRTLNLVFPDEP